MWNKDKLTKELKKRIIKRGKGLSPEFKDQFDEAFPPLLDLWMDLYGHRWDFLYQLEDLLRLMVKFSSSRSESLKELDKKRLAEPHWFHDGRQLAVMLYVDLFAQDLKGLEKHLDYLADLGVTLVHLMPLFDSPQGDSDGGYAVSDYQKVHPSLGTMDDLAQVADKMRRRGMSLILDFILNHTADNHQWARKAKEGEEEFQNYYFLFEESTAREYDQSLREIFPTVRRGSFTYEPKVKKWVWTTFNSFQWDLNYQNPDVFRAMAEQMLFLANQGAEVLRLDALAFCWKEKGTLCESLPKAHTLIQAFKGVARIAAPALSFLSEAIVHPDEVIQYISPKECELSYNPLVMATSWEALATRETRLLKLSLEKRFALPRGTAWVNYLRSHDDIGWTFSDEDAAQLGIDGYHHRRFLNQFYTGRFPGSFARGVPFQENPTTGDARISGTLASLAGLEKALKEEGPREVDLALGRILLLCGFNLSLPGIPLLYAGDEGAMLNDYSYTQDPAKSGDSRWVHRLPMDWGRIRPEGDRILTEFIRMVGLRQKLEAFSGILEMVKGEDPALLAFRCRGEEQELLVLANFSEKSLVVEPNSLRIWGGGYRFIDHLSSETVEGNVIMDPYQLRWLEKEDGQ